MADISYLYSKKLKEFSRICDFQSYEPETLCEVAPNEAIRKKFLIADPISTEIQNVPEFSEVQTNTESVHLKNKGMTHIEGGWPLTIDPTEFEEKAKYCKRVERNENYYAICKGLIGGPISGCLSQNNAIDIYGRYFKDAHVSPFYVTDPVIGASSLKIISVYKDPSDPRRSVSALCWNNDCKKFAVAYCDLRFQGSSDSKNNHSYIWDVQNPSEPAETLSPASSIVSVEYYPKDPNLLASGSHNGVVNYWDVRQLQRPAGKSHIDEGHKDPVWAVKWLQSKTGELLTVSTDGQALVWDLRLTERPVEIHLLAGEEPLILQPKSDEGAAKGVLGGLCLDYDPQVGGPAKYLIGTEQGTIISCNRKGKSQHEKLGNTFNGHIGPVYAIQRNPLHPKYFLSVGDWTARLWFEDFKSMSMYQSFYHKSPLTYGCWHPIRAGVFFTTRMDGFIDVWDLFHHQSTPDFSLQVSDVSIQTVKATHEGHHLAVGGSDGTISLLELSPSLFIPVPNEKAIMGRIFENESLRDKNLDKLPKEKKQAMQAKMISRDLVTEHARMVDIEKKSEEAVQNYLDAVRAEEEAEERRVSEKMRKGEEEKEIMKQEC